MKLTNKSIVAASVAMAFAGVASAATLEQFRMGADVTVYGGERKASLQQSDKETKQPSAYLVQLNAQPTSYALSGVRYDRQQAQQLTQKIEEVQQQVSAQLLQLDKDAQILTTTKHLAASIVVKADAKALASLRKNPAVKQILPVYDSKPMVVESQEYIKAKSVVASGIATGAGIKVAILDSGLDYTHAAFGGAGTEEAYDAAFANQSAVNWPQGKVLGGYDFINNDPNPIDPLSGGHGTSVANSVNGIAPDVEFYAYTVCTGTCPGLAQINALEAAMDPDGDGDLSDRVDVINMSLGGDFGSTDTSGGTQLLIQRAVELGVSMVISAGNDGPNPFIVGGPSTTPNALSVGAMTHPTAETTFITTSTIAGATVPMAAAGFNPVSEFSFNSAENGLVYIAENGLACDEFAEDVDLTGKAVLVDRGACNFTQKVLNAQAKGAVFVIIANNAAEAGPVNAGGSAPGITIPAVGISLEDGQIIKDLLVEGTEVAYSIVSESFATPGSIADFTSRGPAMEGLLKPEITAPGEQIMVADVGTGTGLAPATGTSFSGPITAGAMSLLRQARPELNAFEAKAMLMNTANMNVTAEPLSVNPQAALAPITAMGAGLVDVSKAVSSPAAAWVYDAKFDTKQAALSYGLQNMTEQSSFTKTVTLKNFSEQARIYGLTAQPRFADDAATGALSWNMPASIEVGAGQTVQFDITLNIDPTKLPAWELANGSVTGEKNDLLTAVEFDGAILFNDNSTGASNDLHLVYHVLPKANADLQIRSEITDEGIKYVVRNDGAITAQPFAAQLVGTSDKDGVPQDLRAATLDVFPVDYCSSGYLLAPNFTLDQPLSHALQANFTLVLDNDNDGNFDYEVMSLLLSRLGDNYPTGYVGSFAVPFGTLSGFAGDAFHVSGQRNITLTACLEDVGLSAADIGKEITVGYLSYNDGYNLGLAFSSLDFDDVIFTTATLALSPDVTLTDSAGEEVTDLAAGQTAYLNWETDNGFVLLSDAGDAIAVADINGGDKAPVVMAGQMFTVQENAADGTVIGKVDAEVDFSTPVSEFVLAASSSTAVSLQANGDIVVNNSGVLDFDAGLTQIQLEVIALDTKGNASAPVEVTVDVTNTADEAPTVSASQVVSTINVGVAAGTKVANIAVSVNEAGATLANVTSGNGLFAVVNNQLVLARVPTKADAKAHNVVVTATDSAGLSGTTTVNVTVNKPSSGTFGWFSLLALPLLMLRRKRN
ncbi:S8 family serine peptidase [Rheinheimera baltica]|uniref:S8 family serine peptidase n=1 Tax=Rheinheimera baltica TaxID=67576 RepID=A0ABT9I4L4_9GAMM|nr:S8 family serine peptidase [Rheinheimera baltica]MDP5138033.1 S8 family serine peptidase [Rheinheimera baltica]